MYNHNHLFAFFTTIIKLVLLFCSSNIWYSQFPPFFKLRTGNNSVIVKSHDRF